MPRKKGVLTLKQKIFAQKYIEKKSPMEAALESFNCKDKRSAAVVGLVTLRYPQVQREIERIMEAKDLTDEILMEKLKEGLEAKHVSDYKGEATQTGIPDLKTRHKYLETAVDIKGLKAPTQIESKSLNIDLELESLPLENILKLIREQLKLLKASK